MIEQKQVLLQYVVGGCLAHFLEQRVNKKSIWRFLPRQSLELVYSMSHIHSAADLLGTCAKTDAVKHSSTAPQAAESKI